MSWKKEDVRSYGREEKGSVVISGEVRFISREGVKKGEKKGGEVFNVVVSW